MTMPGRDRVQGGGGGKCVNDFLHLEILAIYAIVEKIHKDIDPYISSKAFQLDIYKPFKRKL